MELSPDQQSCFDAIMSWYSDSGNFISLGGFSGTGKTTLISHLRNALPASTRIAFVAFTGKAASVLRSQLP
jgi:molybdopterin-guanine dinucleotide biosynthesis protein